MDSHTLEARLLSIESRLSAMEARFSPNPAPTPPPVRVPAPPVATPEKTPGNWLGIIAIICFILAAGFIIKLSIESGWLTPVRQVGLAVLLGLGLIAASFMLPESEREYASLLPAAGIIIFYLAAFAAYRYYSLLSFEQAITWVSLVSVLCIGLYRKIKHDIYAVTAAVGAYLSPLYMGFDTSTPFSLYYNIICSVAFAAISVWVQSRTLTLVSAYLAIVMSGIAGFGIGQDKLVTLILALQFWIFACSTYFYTRYNNTPLTEAEAASLLPVLLAFYAIEYYFIGRIDPGWAPWVSLGFAAVLVGLYLSAKKYFPDSLGSQSLIIAFTAIACFHSIYLELLPDAVRPWLFVAIMLCAAFLPARFPVPKQDGLFIIPVIAVAAVMVIEYGNILFHLFEKGKGTWLALAFAALGSMWAMIVMKRGKGPALADEYGSMVLSAAHVLAVSGCYKLTEDAGSLAVSASWLLYAAGVMGFAFKRKDEVMAKSALLVLVLAFGKALLYDAASAPTIVRIFCLLLTGAVLYGCGLLMRNITGWKGHSPH